MDFTPADVFVLPGRMDASTLTQTHADLIQRRGTDLDIEASQVDRFGAQALQLLLSAIATWRDDGFRLRIVDPSDAVRTAFDQLGCAPILNAQTEIAA
ncbi:MAG: STAS domain-containing protein [Brevundimonas sp.]|uniref:STAS domain-containing protein n=1 Tax=Brevundimonas sp. TaxID=1871086 RepID=UPI0027368D0E|nr:STAS domain-containing protein [Brevundimonas sp.]MBX9615132.1 STAS domain-containing protein [Caulobacteraceae bacterium]MDP3406376.1 STAS domain-containing protein [Brevundimonas sp.]